MAKLDATTFVLVGDNGNEKELVASPEGGEILNFYLGGKEIFHMDRENFIQFSKMVLKTEESA